MSLTSDVKTLIKTKFPNATVILSSWFKANLASYDLETMTIAEPLIVINNEIRKDKEIQENFNILSDSELIIWCLVKGDVYDSDDAMNTDIEALEVIADQIYSIINQASQYRLKGTDLFKFTITPKFKIWNSVLNGVEAKGRVKENQVRNICKVP